MQKRWIESGWNRIIDERKRERLDYLMWEKFGEWVWGFKSKRSLKFQRLGRHRNYKAELLRHHLHTNTHTHTQRRPFLFAWYLFTFPFFFFFRSQIKTLHTKKQKKNRKKFTKIPQSSMRFKKFNFQFFL